MTRVAAKLKFPLAFVVLLSISPALAQQSSTNKALKTSDKRDGKTVVLRGTQIKVNVSEDNPPRNVPSRTFEGKIASPVQAGSEVAIPALTKVIVQVSGRHYDSGYQEVMELKSIVVDGKSYDVQTDQVPLLPGSISEAQFALLKDLTIEH